jgi:hypothetical protein
MDQTPLYLAAQDVEEIRRFVRGYANVHFIARPCAPLFHYTTGDNLIRILDKGKLWSTQASCLNDMTELIYAAHEFRKRVIDKLSDSHDQRIDPFLHCLNEVLMNAYLLSVKSPLFVTCFSEHRDDLSQWRAYSGGEGGYTIQFDPNKLVQTGELQVWLVKVNYKPEDHTVMFDEVLRWGEQRFVELECARRVSPNQQAWVDEFVGYYIWSLGLLAACLKHPKFEGEREWRLIYQLRDDDVEGMQFRQRQSMMSRHLPLRLPQRLPITGVVVGPCRHPELSKIAVCDLLKQAGYDLNVVKVEITDVPYRTT